MARPTNPDAQPVVSPLIPPGGRGECHLRGDCRRDPGNSLTHSGQCRSAGRGLRRIFFDRRYSRFGPFDGAGGKRFGVPGRIEIALRATGAPVQPRTRTSGIETTDQKMKRSPCVARVVYSRRRGFRQKGASEQLEPHFIRRAFPHLPRVAAVLTPSNACEKSWGLNRTLWPPPSGCVCSVRAFYADRRGRAPDCSSLDVSR